MKLILKPLLKPLILLSLVIPLGVFSYLTFSGSDSVQVSFSTVTGIIVIVYYSLLLVAGIIWIVLQLKSVLSVKNELRKNELLHLQSQVNPHFFFNMLNNIYGTIDKDSEIAKKLILKLSDLMRYSIYEGKKQRVFLKDEIEFLQNYIDLHIMRYHKKIDVQFKIEIEDHIKIMPLLLIILLENAFKHGVENLIEKAFIHLSVKAHDEQVKFEIENNFDDKEVSKESGIGISNLKRRLNLVYPK
ncbi:histidine kinase, partial [Saprospiraceae bacterium]|nr:histidine kinase [Saprospiraceae bacterium]